MKADYFEPMSDQEDMANEALGALEGLHDLISGRAPGDQIPAEPLAHLVKAVCYLVVKAMPDGLPRHRAAVNDIDG